MPKQLVKFATILILILLSTSLNAQVDTTKVDKGVNINFFNGYAISYKWNASQSMSYRVYLSLNSSITNNKYDSESIYNDDPPMNITNDSQDNIYIRTDLSFQFLFNIISNNNFNAYAGLGPNLNYYHSTRKSKSEYEDNLYKKEYESTSNSYGIGIISLLGIEAYLTNAITLFAESHLSGLKSWSNSTDIQSHTDSNQDIITSTSEYSRTGSGWSVNLQLVKVGIGIYF